MRKVDPAAKAVLFFETAPVDVAQTVLAICQAIVARRLPASTKRRGEKRANSKPDPNKSGSISTGTGGPVGELR